MDVTTVAVSAVAGAVTALGTYFVVNQLQTAKAAADANLQRGWYEGRESVLQHFQMNVEPQDFAPSR